MSAQLLFVFIGAAPLTEWLDGVVTRDDHGFVVAGPDLPLEGIHWVIVGGESGPGARKMNPAWVKSIHHQCHLAAVPFFFKQWGGVRKDMTGRVLDGRTYDEMPRPESRHEELIQICS